MKQGCILNCCSVIVFIFVMHLQPMEASLGMKNNQLVTLSSGLRHGTHKVKSQRDGIWLSAGLSSSSFTSFRFNLRKNMTHTPQSNEK